MTRRRWLAVGTAAVTSATLVARRAKRRTAFPPGPEAITPEAAKAAAAALLAKPVVRRRDLAMDLAPAVATTVDPLLHGRRYFPRMLEDIAAARDHVHLLIYGYKPGEIGTVFRDALVAKVRDGVEVRLQVDAIGSEIDVGSRELFRDLVSAGVAVTAHDGLLVVRRGELGARRPAARFEDVLHFDHRKMAVIDGRVAYVGGSGIEDHYNDERFHDVMLRLEGPIVSQLQAVFLLSWHFQGGPLPDSADALDRHFPAQPDGAGVPMEILMNNPGEKHLPIAPAFQAAIDGATRRLYVINPYLADRAILQGIPIAPELQGVG